jgi:SAM-dependent methyltransferase
VTTEALPYLLGHAPEELKRLIRQSEIYADFAKQVFALAGLTSGMHVLDIGCGAGDVSLLAASLVGPSGRVLGIDKSPEAVAFAAERATLMGVPNVAFRVSDLGASDADEEFDAVIGRLVLIYLRDPVDTLQRLAGMLRPGGVLALQELMMTSFGFDPPDLPVFGACRRWILETCARAGIDTDLGLRLPRLFAAAGLPRPRMISGSVIESGPQSIMPDYIGETVLSILPMAERLGVVRPGEVEPETLVARLTSEFRERDATVIAPSMVGAWTRALG